MLLKPARNRQDGVSVVRLTHRGPVIGMLSGLAFEQETLRLSSGDTLVAYSDGISEAMDAEGNEFGEGRLQQILVTSGGLGAEQLVENVIQAVRAWCGAAPQHDDMTASCPPSET